MEPPSAPGPERLFDSHRFPSDGFLLLALLLYAPVGLCLLVLRLFIGVHVFLVSCALPDSVLRRFIVRVMCSVLGLCVQQSDPRLRDAGVRVYIANHVTQFDHNVINLLTSCNTPALNSAPGFICWSRGFMELGVSGSRAELVDSLKAYSSHRGNPPLLLFPEEAATNGRAGLLHFRVWRTPPGLQSCSGPSLSPSQYIKWLPSVPRRVEEPSEDFALRVQELLAMELGVVSTRLTAADRTEHMKRLRHTSLLPFAPASSQALAARRRVPSGLAGAPEDGRIAAMAQQVKEVLPHVPLEVIRIDLAQTNCVDTTIANLLEGRISFFPDSKEAGTDLPAPATSQAPAASGIQGSAAEPSSKAAAKQFAKSPVERHLSLQERKRALYDYARRRFAERSGAARLGGP
ncbi:lipid droplet-regulating VLDL assembly factor AUP1 isoform X2 [Pezoporus wallicus]|uniref:lipid droplet-regulating VLDL assembly factor AUP1 isoform X2 n=1 Tax=Pezoporus wallicus TaxID=35540 RepID=UPI00254C2D3C|nr:lipid droplet-regulating VLDL assembly factor AUP1 isoform X2 [Pezoporus wallicus]XP_061297007.1 lipid droplet-regulating VLDL assembly factor AUP1 isoform X2 [Pezoporus flaviventris]